MSPTDYQLQSIATWKVFKDTGWLLDAPGEVQPTLIRSVYAQKQLELKSEKEGLYRFSDWLPVLNPLKGSSSPVTYKSDGFAKTLGLNNLFITFSGYWPEKGATMRTCSFKETEAFSVGARMDGRQPGKVLVVASAGNTARAFAQVCSDNAIPLLLCVPEDNLNALWFDALLNDCVKLVVTATGSDYFDAIHLSNLACQIDGFYAEGGAKNVARRDGMGTTMLSATTFIGRIPDYYFQAVGSGTGAIAAWEANLRFIEDGRFGSHKMKLMVSQNSPFLPIYEAWKIRSRQMLPYDDKLARQDVETIDAKVLSNRRPPYSIIGGLFDALVDTGGEVLSVDNDAARIAAELFEQTEDIDIHPAAAVATASLIQAVESNQVKKDAVIMLNITGGGEALFAKESDLYYLQPVIVFPVNPTIEEVKEKIGQLSW
ncbi:MAG: cysteate synthase [Bacteroidetes bacterium HGW-Bacteroidetes-1]|jgi:cysteate synthase|nr:MAG: cysteate synthase [Bacteroidetes bacterium HGW-Bacteroidetes-1]